MGYTLDWAHARKIVSPMERIRICESAFERSVYNDGALRDFRDFEQEIARAEMSAYRSTSNFLGGLTYL